MELDGGGVLFPVDFLERQKTDFFFDQRPNRDSVAALSGPGPLELQLRRNANGSGRPASRRMNMTEAALHAAAAPITRTR